MKADAAPNLKRGRSVFFLSFGKALFTASRTIRRCTFSFFDTPAIVPTPNSYSLRISSKSSTFNLQSNVFPRSGQCPPQSTRFVQKGGPKQNSELGQFRLPKSRILVQRVGDHKTGD